MKKILIIYGHGGTDPGASGNGINERDFFRNILHPYLWKWAERSNRLIEFYAGNAFATRHLDKIDPKAYDVIELHLDAASAAATGGHVIIHGDFVPDDQDKRLMSLIQRTFGCRGGKCVDGRRDLQNVNIARARGINYRLVELCFVTNANDVKKLMANLDKVAKEIIEAMTGENLMEPAKPSPKPSAGGGQTDDWEARVKADMVSEKIMSDTNWDKPITKMELGSILYTAKRLGYFNKE